MVAAVSFLFEMATELILGRRSVDLSSLVILISAWPLPESTSYCELTLSPKIVFYMDFVNLIKRPCLNYYNKSTYLEG